MNRELPKLVREALAKQTAGDVQPSPDALTAFVEHSLARGESQRVTDHLAQCAECREVVFLASSAVEEPVGSGRPLLLLTNRLLFWPAAQSRSRLVRSRSGCPLPPCRESLPLCWQRQRRRRPCPARLRLKFRTGAYGECGGRGQCPRLPSYCWSVPFWFDAPNSSARRRNLR